jgi:hypothetical protein
MQQGMQPDMHLLRKSESQNRVSPKTLYSKGRQRQKAPLGAAAQLASADCWSKASQKQCGGAATLSRLSSWGRSRGRQRAPGRQQSGWCTDPQKHWRPHTAPGTRASRSHATRGGCSHRWCVFGALGKGRRKWLRSLCFLAHRLSCEWQGWVRRRVACAKPRAVRSFAPRGMRVASPGASAR